MKILQVIHGYPMRYNAGSEVYTQALCQGLAGRHEVHVFTREEDLLAPEFRLRQERDADDERVTLHLVNHARDEGAFQTDGIDQRFAETLESLKPDLVHFGHLSHLSVGLPAEAAARGIPVVFTLHDYWLMCPRGQFLHRFPPERQDARAVCSGQQHRKCAENCYAPEFAAAPNDPRASADHWADWVRQRMQQVRRATERVDLFVAPSRYLLRRYRDAFGLPARKLTYLDYGFDRTRLSGRKRTAGEPFTFGYIGTHIRAKGIQHLIEAFGTLSGEPRLRIWGRPRGEFTEALKTQARNLPGGAAERVEWLPEYRNRQILPEVFDRVDAVVVPSIWVENSPLVIHEAQQARVPVITADAGGMAEYVRHEHNGLLFEHCSPTALARQMQRLVEDPALAARLGARGYLYSDSGDVPAIDEHARAVERLYRQVLSQRDTARVPVGKGPWRITFDTNPDHCNMRCVMCEQHSPHSTLQKDRIALGKPRRLMPIEMIRRVVAEAVPHGLREIIPTTMGEPLLYKDFDAILDLCAEHGLSLNLTTNGSFPGRGAEAWARRIVPVTSDVKISWNGATRQTQEAIMQGADWQAGLDNLRTFIRVRDEHAGGGGNRCRVTLQLTFMESNLREIPDLVRLAAELGVDRVKGHQLWAHFQAIEGLSMRRSPDAIRRWNETVLAARRVAAECPLPSGEPVLLENFHLLDEQQGQQDIAPGGACPFLGQEAWVSAEGRFDPCCAPDAQRRTLGEFGNLGEQGLMQIWNGPAYRELTAGYRTRSLCLGCNMRKPVGDAADGAGSSQA